ncbi:MAG: AMP-binding protein [Actinomycetia bacterium]|nr:AMP-binding protein [Actinomycetes bacterium]
MAHPGLQAAERPDDTALIIAETGATMSWAELRRQSVQAANTIHDLGIRAGDAVAFCVENRFEFVVLVWACHDAGFRYTPISTRLTPDEVAYIVDDCDARVFIHSSDTASSRDSAMGIAGLEHVIDIDQPDALGQTDERKPVYERAEGVSMLYSSGTTGKPKGVLRPAPPEPIEELSPGDRGSAALFGIDTRSVYLSTAPLYHSAPMTFLIMMGRVGAAVVIMKRFDPARALAHIEHYGVTHSQWVPTMFVRMLRLSEDERTRHDLSTHSFAIHGAGPCTIPIKEAMLDWWGPVIHEYYAGTEGAGMCLIGPDEWLAHKGSVGRSMRGPVLIIDDGGNRLPPGEIGQIWFSNSSDFQYYNDPAKTSESRGASGSGTFGDIGYLDDDGYLYLTDRKSFTINAGGINIYPREVEEVLLGHPAVDDVAVFGVPNDEYGEEVRAVVQPSAGATPDPALVDELTDHCGKHLARFKVPRSIDFVDELPREPTGKLRKHLLREHAMAVLGARQGARATSFGDRSG